MRLDYLAETCPELLVEAKVGQYKDVLHRLTSQAEQLLAQVVRELELSIPAQPRTRLYAQRPGTLRMARTYDGRSVVGAEVEVSGERVVQQHDVTGRQVLRTFRQDGDTFVEQPPAVEEEQGSEATVDAGHARGKARAALRQVSGVISLVRQYAEALDPFGVRTIIANHVSQLKEAEQLLTRAGIESEFGSRLADDIAHLESVQRVHLISTYISTRHPSASGLRFLVEKGLVRITRTVSAGHWGGVIFSTCSRSGACLRPARPRVWGYGTRTSTTRPPTRLRGRSARGTSNCGSSARWGERRSCARLPAPVNCWQSIAVTCAGRMSRA